ncbi:MAG: tetratricopeptide repeat protein [Singulisphaera sp.]
MLGDWPAAARRREVHGGTPHRYLETAWPYLGDICFRLGDLAQARRAYERSLKLHPEGRLANRARFGLGRTLAQDGDPDAALKVLTALARGGGPDWSDKAWFQVGRIQAEKGRFAEAVEAFETLERAAPRGAQVAERG